MAARARRAAEVGDGDPVVDPGVPGYDPTPVDLTAPNGQRVTVPASLADRFRANGCEDAEA